MATRRPAIALFAALAMWAPTLRGFLRGAIDVDSAGIRFLFAFAVAWIAVTIVSVIVAGYGGQPPAPRRRKNDIVAEPSMVTEDEVLPG